MLSDGQRKLLQQRVAEAVAWCATRVSPADPAGCLRSAELRPAVFGEGWADSYSKRIDAAMVEAVASKRNELLKAAPPTSKPAGLEGGRIHLRETGRDVFSGAGQVASNGYVDVDDLPPWDTWLMYVNNEPGFLLSWVPPDFLVLTGRAFQVCEVDCSQWADRPRYDESRPGLVLGDLESLGMAAPPGSPGDLEADPEPGWLRALGRVSSARRNPH